MKKIIREVDEKRGIVQCTMLDERWYVKSVTNPDTQLPEFKYVPSVTWIAGHYPKGIEFYKWLANKGWDEAEAIKSAAGDKGSKVHEAISAILNGEEVRIDSKFVNKSTNQEEELTFEEAQCIKSFVDWKTSLKSFEPLAWDIVTFSDIHNYSGMVDLVARVNGDLYVIDFKTSQYVWTEYEMQVSAYRMAIENGENPIEIDGKQIDISGMKTAILQVGYRRNKNMYKFTEVEDKFDLFLTAQKIWKNEQEGVAPKKIEMPIILSPKFEKEVSEPKEVKKVAKKSK